MTLAALIVAACSTMPSPRPGVGTCEVTLNFPPGTNYELIVLAAKEKYKRECLYVEGDSIVVGFSSEYGGGSTTATAYVDNRHLLGK